MAKLSEVLAEHLSNKLQNTKDLTSRRFERYYFHLNEK